MRQNDLDLLRKHGWTVECKSPFEIRHEDGSFATGQAANMVLDSLGGLEVEEGECREILKDVMLKVAGKPFRCDCGCNVFHHPKQRPENLECNVCGTWFSGEK